MRAHAITITESFQLRYMMAPDYLVLKGLDVEEDHNIASCAGCSLRLLHVLKQCLTWMSA
jgi:hypothetical protein